MNALRVYVAGASAEVDMVAGFIARLREADIAITYDWTPDVIANGGAAESTVPAADRQRMLSADLAGVAQADLVWILVPEGVTIGAWAKLGYAMGLGIPVLASGPQSRRTIFTEFCWHCATHEEAFVHLVKRAAVARGDVA